MKKTSSLLAVVVGFLALAILGILAVKGSSRAFAEDSPAEKPKTVFQWPKGAKAAVSLTYDDAIPSQLKNAIPALDKKGLKGTFFLQGNNVGPDNEEKWKAASKEGHEIACHTMLHPCDKKMDWVKKGNALEDYTMDRMSKELDESIALAKRLSGHDGPFTFAYPCGETYVGDGKAQHSYIPLVAKKFLAARTVQWGVEDPRTVSLPEVHDMEGKTEEDLVGAVKKAEAQGGWVVFLFHGVGGDYSITDLKAHNGLLDYLARHKDKVWTGTFGEVAAYVKANRDKK